MDLYRSHEERGLGPFFHHFDGIRRKGKTMDWQIVVQKLRALADHHASEASTLLPMAAIERQAHGTTALTLNALAASLHAGMKKT